MYHSPCSTCLMPIDFHLFGPFNKHVAGKWLAVCGSMKEVVLLATDTLHQFHLGWDTDLDALGAPVGQVLKCQWWLWRSDVDHLIPIGHVHTEVRMKFSISQCFSVFSPFVHWSPVLVLLTDFKLTWSLAEGFLVLIFFSSVLIEWYDAYANFTVFHT